MSPHEEVHKAHLSKLIEEAEQITDEVLALIQRKLFGQKSIDARLTYVMVMAGLLATAQAVRGTLTEIQEDRKRRLLLTTFNAYFDRVRRTMKSEEEGD